MRVLQVHQSMNKQKLTQSLSHLRFPASLYLSRGRINRPHVRHRRQHLQKILRSLDSFRRQSPQPRMNWFMAALLSRI
jgi:hypothetical protein